MPEQTDVRVDYYTYWYTFILPLAWQNDLVRHCIPCSDQRSLAATQCDIRTSLKFPVNSEQTQRGKNSYTSSAYLFSVLN